MSSNDDWGARGAAILERSWGLLKMLERKRSESVTKACITLEEPLSRRKLKMMSFDYGSCDPCDGESVPHLDYVGHANGEDMAKMLYRGVE